MRSYTTGDLVRRVLEYKKFKVTHVMNITDVGHLHADADDTEDKMEKAAREEKKSPLQIAEFYTAAFLSDMKKIRNKEPAVLCKATDHIPDMIKLIQTLEKKGFVYLTKNGVYFDTQKFSKYGQFARMDLNQLKGVREDVTRDPEKKHPGDFRLWQLNQPHHILQWESPWGKGYPGWHIECSAMSMKYLGTSFDIHTGGIDNIFPHHQNEIAQSEGATGKPFVQYWVHTAHVLVNNQKMSKSLRNIYTFNDLEKKGFDALDYRFLLLTAHYRSELNFTWESLEGAQKTRKNWNEFIKRLQKYSGKGEKGKNAEVKEWIQESKEKIESFLDDDLNTPLVLAELSAFSRKINDSMSKNELSKMDARKVLDFLQSVNEVLAVFDFSQEGEAIPAHMIARAKEREAARKGKDWKKADALRKEIEAEGYLIMDTKDGFEITPKN
jgi:cysteinyl-tRNA synthetase